MSKILELDEILKLGNEGAPEEWLRNLTGQGIGDGFEGVHDDILDELMQEEDSDDPLLPHLPIEATPEIQFYQCNSRNYTIGRGGNTITHILVHYTAGANTSEGAALANCRYFGRSSVGASAHYFIDSGYTIWQSVPDNCTAWHAGNWAMNQRSIGIEVCSAGAFTTAEIDRLTWLVQHLMQKYNIPASRVIRHYDVTGKKCPAYYVDSARWKTLHTQITGGKVSGTGNTTSSNKAPAPSAPSITDKSGDAIYQAFAAGKWWDYVTNWGSGTEGYAGVIGKPLNALRAYIKGDAKTVGYLEYRLHKLGGNYYNWQRDREKDKNGENYAGDCRNRFDGLQMRLVGVSGKHVRYRVHVIGKGWLAWVTDYGNGDNGYAGWYGYPIDAVQVEII